MDNCNQALDFYKSRSQVTAARLLNRKGAIFEKLHKLPEALECFEASCSLSKAAFGDDIYQYANVWFNSGQVYLQMQHYEEAEARTRQAIAAFENRLNGPVPVPPGYYMGLGRIYLAQGQLDLTQKYCLKALDCAAGNTRAAVLQNMGALYRKQSRVTEAKTYFKQAMQLYQENGDLSGLATFYASIGHVKRAAGEPEAALFPQFPNKLRRSTKLTRGIYEHERRAEHPNQALPNHC